MNVLWLLKILSFFILDNKLVNASNCASNRSNDHENFDYFIVETKNYNNNNNNTEIGIKNIENIHKDWKFEYSIDFLNNFHVFSLPKNHHHSRLFDEFNFESIDNIINQNDLINNGNLLKRENKELIENLYNNNVYGIQSLKKRKLEKRLPVPIDYSNTNLSIRSKQDSTVDELNKISEEFEINDPLFKDQWHIFNTAHLGNDVNVIPVWRMNITGNGIVTALIDDGLDYESEDLKDNYCPEGSWDYNDNRPNPKPMLSNDYHGTRCAAEIAASKGNNYCGVGVAFNSKVSGIRILSGEITSEQEAQAMIYGLDVNDIYSCSWGPPDNGKSMDAPDKLIRSAILKGVQDGRNGKGALYVFASGNGGTREDGCNFDGYTNSIYSLTVSAIDYKGLHPQYSESCTAVMVSTFSSGSGEHIHTTDINNQCSDNHGGTSAAAPLAAGIYALILEANPDLTWRDVQYLTVLSAAEIDPFDNTWQNSAIPNRKYSSKYGWGKIDAEKMVSMAQNDWKLLKPQSWYYTPFRFPNLKLENEIGSVDDSFTITEEILQKANFEKIEQITVTVNIKSNKRGKVEVELISPNGIISKLAHSRSRDRDTSGFKNWTFSTVAHWDENAVGEWKIKVYNVEAENSISFDGWQMRLFGECINPKLAKRFELNEDYSVINDEDNEDNDNNETETESSTASETSTTSIESSTTNTIDTPTTEVVESTSATGEITTTENVQPTTTTEESTPTTSLSSSIPTSDDQQKGNGNDSYENPDKSTHFIGYFFALLVVGFGILLYIILTRRKPGRARRREDFEFDIIRPDDDDSRFEFDDDDDDDDDEFNVSDFDNDNNDINSKPLQNSKNDNFKLDSSSEFDLGSSNLKGHETSDKIIKDVINHETNTPKSKDEDYSNERTGLINDNDDELSSSSSSHNNKDNSQDDDRLIL